MIVVHINPAGIEKVYFQADSDVMEDLSLAVWPVVRQELNRLNLRLRRSAKKSLEMVESSQNGGRL